MHLADDCQNWLFHTVKQSKKNQRICMQFKHKVYPFKICSKYIANVLDNPANTGRQTGQKANQGKNITSLV